MGSVARGCQCASQTALNCTQAQLFVNVLAQALLTTGRVTFLSSIQQGVIGVEETEYGRQRPVETGNPRSGRKSTAQQRPAETQQALQRLLAAGYSRQQAVERIAAALVKELWQILHERQRYDRERYTAWLDEIE
jgi:hypothetical protein